MQKARCYSLLTGLLVAGLGADWSHAQAYPTKPIRLHAGSAGGSSDAVSRLIAQEISGPLGQQVVVENQAPAALASGVARAAPDGYTLLITGGLLWVAPLFSEQSYDTERDFIPITSLTRQVTILAVHPSLPAKSVAELVKLARARPGELNYSSSSDGTSSHISGEIFKFLAGVNIVRVTYKTQGPEMSDLVSGQVHMTFGSGPTMMPLVKSGRMRALATSGATRSVLYPDWPSIAETLPGYEAEQLLGLLAPGKTPDAVVRRLNQEAVRAINKPESRDRMLKIGLEPGGGTPEEFVARIRGQVSSVSKFAKK